MDQPTQLLKGVNLGGWLLTEKWITPSLYEGTTATDEYSLVKSQQGRQRLAKHRQEFITKSDIEWLVSHSINALRIPVGYWLFDGEFDDSTKQEPSINLLDQAMDWAGQYKLKILIDLHGLAGSQNGMDHSGRTGKTNWLTAENQAKNLDITAKLVSRYRDHAAFWGIEIANEPAFGVTGRKLRAFNQKAYRLIRKIARPGSYTVFSDGYRPNIMSGSLPPKADFPIVIDSHFYQIFATKDKKRSVAKQLELAANHQLTIHNFQRKQPVIIGEWSGVLVNNSDTEVTRQYLKTQQASYSAALGWFYWTYKTEGKSAWNFRHMVERGLF